MAAAASPTVFTVTFIVNGRVVAKGTAGDVKSSSDSAMVQWFACRPPFRFDPERDGVEEDFVLINGHRIPLEEFKGNDRVIIHRPYSMAFNDNTIIEVSDTTHGPYALFKATSGKIIGLKFPSKPIPEGSPIDCAIQRVASNSPLGTLIGEIFIPDDMSDDDLARLEAITMLADLKKFVSDFPGFEESEAHYDKLETNRLERMIAKAKPY